MELRKAADLLLRSQTSPLATLLYPSSASRWAAGAQFCSRAASNRPAQRALTNSARNNSLRPQPTTSAAPTGKDSNAPSDSIDELSKSLWARKSRSPPTPPRLDAEDEKRFNGGSSALDILTAINERSPTSSKTPSTFDAMLSPTSLNDNKSLMNDLYKGPMSLPKTPRIPMRLEPSTGRSISVGTGIDFARGLRLLEQSCARNRVRADFTSQRFHERGGLKRKRLRRQRWRKRFMEGFKATVGRVKQLKNQGW